jgi:NAD(P)-dependent dehydrogenase (short-subunit alcohol dehydrogenase family)
MSRSVLVTGAASGNGRAIATRFLILGDRVAAVDLDFERLEAVRDAAWSENGKQVLCLTADVSRQEDIERMVADTVAAFGGLDVIVNNAGITGDERATTCHETPVEEFDRVIAVNLRGVFLGCRAAIPVMLDRGGGVIINLASAAGLIAFPGRAAYVASKGAVVQLSKSIAVDYGAKGIRCNALCPGMIETPMTKWRLDQPELRQAMLAMIPQREIGTVEDVAGAAVFLASDDARYVNGAPFLVDGGWTAW